LGVGVVIILLAIKYVINSIGVHSVMHLIGVEVRECPWEPFNLALMDAQRIKECFHQIDTQ
jgi:hypothetical protein